MIIHALRMRDTGMAKFSNLKCMNASTLLVTGCIHFLQVTMPSKCHHASKTPSSHFHLKRCGNYSRVQLMSHFKQHIESNQTFKDMVKDEQGCVGEVCFSNRQMLLTTE